MTRLEFGIGSNRGQFALLVAINAFVGATVGLERSVLPLLADSEFGIASTTAALSFLVVFGSVKAATNRLAGRLTERHSRRRILIVGWVFALPVAPIIIWAPSWEWILVANFFLGVNQGLAWSMTVVMKIDLAGPRQRGLAIGINETAGYVAVALSAWTTGALAAAHGPRPGPFLLGIGLAAAGLILSLAVRDTTPHARLEETAANSTDPLPPRGARFWVLNQAGLVNNLNDGMAWGLLPLFLAGEGLTVGRIGIVAAVYPASWGLAQIATGAWSDRVGRKPLVVSGLTIQAGAIFGLTLTTTYAGWIAMALVMGLGTALVYPTLIAATGDLAVPAERPARVGDYRMWRDIGLVVGALIAGAVSDLVGMRAAIVAIGVVTAGAAAVSAALMDTALSRPDLRSGLASDATGPESASSLP